jgi:hypothetical protein
MPLHSHPAIGGITYHVLSLREDGKQSDILSQWPMERPKDWFEFVNESDRQLELEDHRLRRGGSFSFLRRV